jgi:CMP-N,N'-diacetyllegionaminic acid synthase
MNILITICARGGSKGVPGKNIKNLAGKPLINYTIELAKRVNEKFNGNISLSTDDFQIRDIALKMGISTDYIRPDFLATDTASKVDTIKHLIDYEELRTLKKFDFILDLDVTSPLRTVDDVMSGFEKLILDPYALNLFSVNPASRNPYFNMVELNDKGYYGVVKKINNNINSRQTAPKVFELNASFYWYKKSFFELGEKSVITDRSLIFEMNHICFDLDDNINFLFMGYLIEKNKLGFTL